MLRLHQANSSRKWRSMMKNAKISEIWSVAQYVEDFKLWVLAAGNTHRITEKNEKIFVDSSLRFFVRFILDLSRLWYMWWLKQDMSYPIIVILSKSLIESSAREVKIPESKDRTPESHISRKSGCCTKTTTGASFAKDSWVSSSKDNGHQGCRVFQVSQEMTLRKQIPWSKSEG